MVKINDFVIYESDYYGGSYVRIGQVKEKVEAKKLKVQERSFYNGKKWESSFHKTKHVVQSDAVMLLKKTYYEIKDSTLGFQLDIAPKFFIDYMDLIHTFNQPNVLTLMIKKQNEKPKKATKKEKEEEDEKTQETKLKRKTAEVDELSKKKSKKSGKQESDVKEKQKTTPKNKRTDLPVGVRKSAWNKYIGEGSGSGLCFVCRCSTLTHNNYHTGHVVAVAKNGSDDISNLRPICASCNQSMGKMDMRDYIKKHYAENIQYLDQYPQNKTK